jgi:hypothetical protein
MSQFLTQTAGQTGKDIDVPFGTDIRLVDEHLLAIFEFRFHFRFPCYRASKTRFSLFFVFSAYFDVDYLKFPELDLAETLLYVWSAQCLFICVILSQSELWFHFILAFEVTTSKT